MVRETPTLYPENLLDEQSADFGDRRWWVIYTRARQEKALTRDLLGRGIPFYLPLVKKTSVYRRRSVSSQIPLFSGYVFLHATEQERVSSLTTNRVSRVLDVADPQKLRFDLNRIRRLIASDAPLTVESRIAPAQRIRIKSGPLAGMEGTVLVRRAETRLLVTVDFLQQGASIAVDDFMLEPLD